MRIVNRTHTKIFRALSFITLLTCLQAPEALAQTEDELSPTEQAIASIAISTAKGDVKEISTSLHQGLDNGLTINEVKEELVHLYAYCGFPRSLMAINTLSEVLAERKANGIQDVEGTAGTAVEGDDKYEMGKNVLAELTGVDNRPRAGYAETVPIIEVFLKEHLFADIFKRGVLSYDEREIATVAALLSMGNLEPMVRGHMGIAMHQGVSPAQLNHMLDIIEKQVGPEKAYKGRILLAGLTDEERPDPASALSDADELIFPRGAQISAPVFTGTAYLTSLVTADEINTNSVGVVTFERGSRTFWHQHPTGQIIIPLSGKGYYQEKGSPKKILEKGETVKCPADTPHWHGASIDEGFVQMAITGRSKGPTQWFEKVTDEEYND